MSTVHLRVETFYILICSVRQVHSCAIFAHAQYNESLSRTETWWKCCWNYSFHTFPCSPHSLLIKKVMQKQLQNHHSILQITILTHLITNLHFAHLADFLCSYLQWENQQRQLINHQHIKKSEVLNEVTSILTKWLTEKK